MALLTLPKTLGFQLYLEERWPEFSLLEYSQNDIEQRCVIDWEDLPDTKRQEFEMYGKILVDNRAIVRDMFREETFEWEKQPIVICDFNLWVQPNMKLIYWPAEVGLVALSLTEGLIDNFGRIIDKGHILRDDVRKEAAKTAKQLGIPKVGSTAELQNYSGLVTTIQAFLEKHKGQMKGKDLYVFCHDTDFVKVSRCLDWLYGKATRISFPVKILSLSYYVLWACYVMAEFVTPRCHLIRPPYVKEGRFSSDKSVEREIRNVPFYGATRELCCVYHYKTAKEMVHCSLHRANWYAYRLLDILTEYSAMPNEVGKHTPDFNNLDHEKDKRHGMLQYWGITELEEDMEAQPYENPAAQEIFG